MITVSILSPVTFSALSLNSYLSQYTSVYTLCIILLAPPPKILVAFGAHVLETGDVSGGGALVSSLSSSLHGLR